jgi:hypothetical protein
MEIIFDISIINVLLLLVVYYLYFIYKDAFSVNQII